MRARGKENRRQEQRDDYCEEMVNATELLPRANRMPREPGRHGTRAAGIEENRLIDVYSHAVQYLLHGLDLPAEIRHFPLVTGGFGVQFLFHRGELFLPLVPFLLSVGLQRR